MVSVLLGAPEVVGSAAPDPIAMGDMSAMTVTDVDDEHAAALTVLADSGLVPPLRLVPRSA